MPAGIRSSPAEGAHRQTGSVRADQPGSRARARSRAARRTTLNLGRFERRAGEVLLGQDVQDRRLIDVVAGRLVYANDLALARIDDVWRLVGVDPNPRPILQRFVPALSRRDRPRSAPILDWNEIQPFVGHVRRPGCSCHSVP